ncbi:YcaO-like family protein [Nocardiopsis trehalosi]|uniref:YcaO-like family protein n=1 Tax=Nocardiopsis trehalosi TaxID=109329 RepID=UPI00082E726D|nr:YcaO-like family protein [Nocardiopsis trehalosi]
MSTDVHGGSGRPAAGRPDPAGDRPAAPHPRDPQGPPDHGGERAFDLTEAWHRARRTLRHLGYRPRLTDLGGAWRCRLLHADQTPVPAGLGAGKGDPAAARVGAVFEALEHASTHAGVLRPDHVVLRPVRALTAGAWGTDPAVLALDPGARAPLACRTHTALDGRSPDVDVPVFLSCPSYLGADAAPLRAALGDTHDYAPAARYSTNSGTAIGSTRTEALVHALAEVVERDAYSLLLAAVFLGPGGRAARLVRPESLPDDLARWHDLARRRVHGPVHLLDMTTDLGVPAFSAHARCGGGAPVQGQGASLSARLAVRRALTELVQCAAMADHDGADAVTPDLRALRPYPALLAAGRADLGPHLAAARPVDFHDTAAPATPGGHLRGLVAAVAARGHTPYAADVRTTATGVCTVSVVVPGLERFFAVTGGAPVVPGPRARAHLSGPVVP